MDIRSSPLREQFGFNTIDEFKELTKEQYEEGNMVDMRVDERKTCGIDTWCSSR